MIVANYLKCIEIVTNEQIICVGRKLNYMWKKGTFLVILLTTCNHYKSAGEMPDITLVSVSLFFYCG